MLWLRQWGTLLEDLVLGIGTSTKLTCWNMWNCGLWVLVFGAEHILNNETAGDWTFLIYPRKIPEEDDGSVSLTSMTFAWVPHDYFCSTVLAPLVISAHAQSSKVQTFSLCLDAAENHLFPDLWAARVISLQRTLFKTVAKGSGLWILPLILGYASIPWKVSWFVAHSRCHSAHGVCSQPVCISPISVLKVHSTCEPTIPNVCLWPGKPPSYWEELLAIHSAKGFK